MPLYVSPAFKYFKVTVKNRASLGFTHIL